MENARRVLFHYDGAANQQEPEIAPVPEMGDVISRNDKRWRVIDVIERKPVSGGSEPIFFVYLSSVE